MARQKSLSGYKNKMVTKTTPQGNTTIKITLTKEQYDRALVIAKRSHLSIDEVIQRYITKCIADLNYP